MNLSFLSDENSNNDQEKSSAKMNQESVKNADGKVNNKIEDEPHD